MKLYDLKPGQKIILGDKIYTFIKIDGVYGNRRDEEGNFIIGFHAADNVDKYLIDNKNKNGETDRVQSLGTGEELGV